MTPPEEYRLIPLTRGQFAKVSPCDYEALALRKWHAVWCKYRRSYYAQTWEHSALGKQRVWMHRLLMNCRKGDGTQVDHINGDPLDNQRINLRLVNHSQNMMNRKLQSNTLSGHRGVSWCKQTRKWKVRVGVGEKVIWRGRYADKDVAIKVALETYAEAYGEYARLS